MIALPDLATAQMTITPSAGFSVTWDGNDGDFFDATPPPAGSMAPDNLALASNGGIPFGSSESPFVPTHQISNLNDGFYGNSNSHINSATPAPAFSGIALPSSTELTAIAWGRDNGNGAFDDSTPGTDACGGQCDDRWGAGGAGLGAPAGTYTLQITTVADPNATTPEADWTTIATIEYQGGVDIQPGDGFTPWLRHQFQLSTDGGDPLAATGVRLILPGAGDNGAIDEIELYAGEVPIPVLNPVESGGEIGANNLALGETAFAKDVLAGRAIASLNDQVPGDASAWAGDTPDSFAGVKLDGLQEVRSFAFGRDNTGAQTDRALGEYTLQFTDVAEPDETTPDGDWTTIGTILYEAGDPADPHLRHRFNFGAKMATGIRLLTPDGAAIDELEVYEESYVAPLPPALTITPAAGYTASWDGNDGDFFDAVAPPDGAIAPDNLALASNGGIPFASSESVFVPTHQISHLNDGFYGNSNSHINDTNPNPAFSGIALPQATLLSAIAWGRDNGNGAFDDSDPGTDACFGQCDDRSVGNYTLQFTTVDAPDASTPDEDWTSIADFTYTGGVGTDNEPGGLFTEWLRHQYEIAADGGGAIIATGVRILVPDPGVCIDEIELYGSVSTAPFEITAISYDDATGEVSLTFNSQPGKFYALFGSTLGDLTHWQELDDAVVGAPGGTSTVVTNTATEPGTTRRYFQIREF